MPRAYSMHACICAYYHSASSQLRSQFRATFCRVFEALMPLLVSTKVLSKQGVYTKILRDWRIVSISDETAVYLNVTALFEGIKCHQFDEHEPLTLEKEDQPLKVQIGNSQNAKNFQDLPLSALVRDVVSMFGLYMKFFLLEDDEGPSSAVQQRENPP